jgi:hypothetical protein
MKPTEIWLAFWMGLWLCLLPLRLHADGVLRFLQQLKLTSGPCPGPPRLELEAVVRVTRWMCRQRLFRSRLFPRTCLRQALTLYAVLGRLGYPVAIHFGVAKDGDLLQAHSWVTVHGQPVGEPEVVERWQVIYTAAAGHGAGGQGNQRSTKPS